MSQIKCADCNCTPEKCKKSPSAKECSNCTLDECCCWESIQKNEARKKLSVSFYQQRIKPDFLP